MSLIDIDSFEAPKGKGGNIVFVRAKNLPVTFKPMGGILPYQSVFDQDARRNRPVRPNDAKKDINSRYLINGLDPDGNVKAYDLGAQTIEAIKTVRRAAIGFNQSPDVYVTISSKGAGMDTEYFADPAKVDKSVNALKVPADKLLDLHAVRDQIVHPEPEQQPPDQTGTPGTPMGDDDMPWAK